MKMPHVYIPQEPSVRDPETGQWRSKGLNLVDSTRFGEMVVVWPPGASIYAVALVSKRALEIAERYDEQSDFLLSAGSPSLMMALAWGIGYKGKQLRILEWDRRMRRYYSTTGE